MTKTLATSFKPPDGAGDYNEISGTVIAVAFFDEDKFAQAIRYEAGQLAENLIVFHKEQKTKFLEANPDVL